MARHILQSNSSPECLKRHAKVAEAEDIRIAAKVSVAGAAGKINIFILKICKKKNEGPKIRNILMYIFLKYIH